MGIAAILFSLIATASAVECNRELFKGLSAYQIATKKYLDDHKVDYQMISQNFQILPNSVTHLNIYALKRKLLAKKDIVFVPYIRGDGDLFLGRLSWQFAALNIILDDLFRNGMTNANYQALKDLEK